VLTPEEVRHIAQLARVGVTDEDVERMRVQLSQILEHFEALAELETADIPPTAFAVQLENVMRPDESRPSYSKEEILANAPQLDEDYIRVRVVLET